METPGSPILRAPPIPRRVLVIDDDRNTRATLQLCLETAGCEVLQATSRQTALVVLASHIVDLALLDVRLGEENGLDLLVDLLRERPALEVVVISADATIDNAVEAIRRGACDFLAKPFTPAQVRLIVERSGMRPRVAPVLGGDYTAAQIEREHILRVLARAETIEKAARVLDLDVSTLWRKRRKYRN